MLAPDRVDVAQSWRASFIEHASWLFEAEGDDQNRREEIGKLGRFRAIGVPHPKYPSPAVQSNGFSVKARHGDCAEHTAAPSKLHGYVWLRSCEDILCTAQVQELFSLLVVRERSTQRIHSRLKSFGFNHEHGISIAQAQR
eukprot:3696542-Rhodomonas_salina.1